MQIIIGLSTVAWYESTAAMSAAAGTSTITLGTAQETLPGQRYTINFTITSTGTAPELTDDDGKSYYVTQLTSDPATYSGPIRRENEHGVGTFNVTISVSDADIALWNADSTKTENTVVNFTLTSTDPVKLLDKDASTAAGELGAKSDNVEATQTIVVTITPAGVASVTSVDGKAGIAGKYAVRGSSGFQDKAALEASLTNKLTVSL